MYYTGFDPFADRTILCAAASSDGLHWKEIVTDENLEGLVLAGRPGEWDENLESAFVLTVDDQQLLYYSGYANVGNPAKGFPAALGLAISTDGIHFERAKDTPILSPTVDGYDMHAIYSPAVVRSDDGFAMVYCGHAYAGPKSGVRVLGARSNNGIDWTKRDTPVLEGDSNHDWMKDGVAEAALVRDGNTWWLFFTGLSDEERCIGLAKGTSPFGPWDVAPKPIIRPATGTFADRQVLAPFVIVENGKARMWLLGNQQGSEEIRVGYAERDWPPL